MSKEISIRINITGLVESDQVTAGIIKELIESMNHRGTISISGWITGIELPADGPTEINMTLERITKS